MLHTRANFWQNEEITLTQTLTLKLVKLIFSNVFFLFIFCLKEQLRQQAKEKVSWWLFCIYIFFIYKAACKSTKWVKRTVQFSTVSIQRRLYSCAIPLNGSCGRRRGLNFGKTQACHSRVICNRYFSIFWVDQSWGINSIWRALNRQTIPKPWRS